MTLTPAYGRVPTTKAQVMDLWDSNKDFVNASQPITGGGTYINKKDAEKYLSPGTTLQIRYGKGNTKVLVVKL